MKFWVVGVAVLGALIAVGSAGAAALIDSGDVVNGSLTGRDVRNSSLTGSDVKNKSLTKRDFRGSVRGPRGFTGPQGPQGIQGPPGPVNTSGIQVVTAASVTPAGDFGSAIAFCPAGQRVVAGGGFANNGGIDGLLVSEANNARTAWFVIMADNTGFGGTIEAQALCVGADRAVVARDTRAATRREVARLVAELDARRR
jgi:hypothetical protein